MNQIETVIKTVEEELTKLEEINEKKIWLKEDNKNHNGNEPFEENNCHYNSDNEW